MRCGCSTNSTSLCVSLLRSTFLPRERSSVTGQSSHAATFVTSDVQNIHRAYVHRQLNSQKLIATFLGLHSAAQHHPQILNQTIYCPNDYLQHCLLMGIGLVSQTSQIHRWRGKVTRNGDEERWRRASLTNSSETSLCVRNGIEKWISLVHSSVRGSAIEFHSRLSRMLLSDDEGQALIQSAS